MMELSFLLEKEGVFCMLIPQASWVKLVFRESDSSPILVRQGKYYVEDDIFIRIVGDYKTSLIKKSHIISIEIKVPKEPEGFSHEQK